MHIKKNMLWAIIIAGLAGISVVWLTVSGAKEDKPLKLIPAPPDNAKIWENLGGKSGDTILN
jgi:hypothetical protein